MRPFIPHWFLRVPIYVLYNTIVMARWAVGRAVDCFSGWSGGEREGKEGEQESGLLLFLLLLCRSSMLLQLLQPPLLTQQPLLPLKCFLLELQHSLLWRPLVRGQLAS